MKKIFLFCIGLLFPLLIFSDNDFQQAHFDLRKLNLTGHLTPKIIAEQIEKISNSDRQKALYLFLWIAENISYDTESYFGQKNTDTSSQFVLEQRKSVCQGYAGLFNDVAKEMKLESRIIQGFSKGYGFMNSSQISKVPNHSWNAVKIDGKWYLLDSTWGSGYLEGREFKRKLQGFYFMTPPDEFIYDHLPVDPVWELLEKTVSLEDFKKMPYLRPAFFQTGLRLKSHLNYQFTADKNFIITIKSRPDSLLTARLIKNDQSFKTNVFIQKEKDEYKIYVSIPAEGRYILRIFAKKGNSITKSYPWAMDYSIISKYQSNVVYPYSYGHNEMDLKLISPLSGKLQEGKEYLFDVMVPEATSVAVKMGNTWKLFEKEGDRYSAKIKVKKGKIMILVRFSNESSYQGALEFEGI